MGVVIIDCVFCKIINGEIPADFVGESENFVAFLDIRPVNKGHTLVVPKSHFKDFSEFPDGLAAEWVSLIKDLMVRIKNSVGCEGINIGLNNGEAAGQVVMHQHTHLIPRFEDDGLKHWRNREFSAEELRAVAELIKG